MARFLAILTLVAALFGQAAGPRGGCGECHTGPVGIAAGETAASIAEPVADGSSGRTRGACCSLRPEAGPSGPMGKGPVDPCDPGGDDGCDCPLACCSSVRTTMALPSLGLLPPVESPAPEGWLVIAEQVVAAAHTADLLRPPRV